MSKTPQADATGVVRAITWLLLKILATAALLFVLLRLISPLLMTQHNDLTFWIGAACWPAALVVAVWAAVWISQDLAVIRRRIGDRKRLPKVM